MRERGHCLNFGNQSTTTSLTHHQLWIEGGKAVVEAPVADQLRKQSNENDSSRIKAALDHVYGGRTWRWLFQLGLLRLNHQPPIDLAVVLFGHGPHLFIDDRHHLHFIRSETVHNSGTSDMSFSPPRVPRRSSLGRCCGSYVLLYILIIPDCL